MPSEWIDDTTLDYYPTGQTAYEWRVAAIQKSDDASSYASASLIAKQKTYAELFRGNVLAQSAVADIYNPEDPIAIAEETGYLQATNFNYLVGHELYGQRQSVLGLVAFRAVQNVCAVKEVAIRHEVDRTTDLFLHAALSQLTVDHHLEFHTFSRPDTKELIELGLNLTNRQQDWLTPYHAWQIDMYTANSSDAVRAAIEARNPSFIQTPEAGKTHIVLEQDSDYTTVRLRGCFGEAVIDLNTGIEEKLTRTRKYLIRRARANTIAFLGSQPDRAFDKDEIITGISESDYFTTPAWRNIKKFMLGLRVRGHPFVSQQPESGKTRLNYYQSNFYIDTA